MACKNDSDWNTILEPQSESNLDARPLYPYNNISYTESGHLFEMDDTPGRERIRLQHRSNTFIEMHSDGTEVHKIWGDGYEIVLCNKKVLVKGSCTIAVDGNAAIEVKGNAWNTVKGNYVSHIEGNGTINSKKSLYLTAENEISLAADSITFKADQINNVGDIQLQGDLSLNESITVQGNITATGSILGMMGLLSPTSLVIGPLALTVPNKTLLTSFVNIDVLTAISMKSILGTSVLAGGLISLTAGTALTATAGAVASFSGKAGVSISSIAAIGISAVGALTASAEATFIKSELVAFPTALSIAAPLTKLIAAPKAILTVADLMCLDNPMFYSAHMHVTLLGPTSPPLPGPIPAAAAT